MKKNDKPNLGTQRLISRCVLSALALLGAAYAAAADEKTFAEVPLYLDGRTTSKLSDDFPLPKVMLLIDDSGSMEWIPGADHVFPQGSEKSRLQITKEALTRVVNEYDGKLQWGFQVLNNHNVNLPGYVTDKQVMLDTINNKLGASGGTPMTDRYYQVSQIVRDQTAARCERNFMVVMSDGDANGSQVAGGGWEYVYNSMGQVSGYRPIQSGVRPLYANNTINDAYFGEKTGGQYQSSARWIASRNVWSINIWDTVWDRDNGLGWFSKTLATKDFKSSGVDIYGKSWNGVAEDPRDPNNPTESIYKNQLVQTYTVGFGEGLSAEGRKYLENGASSAGNYFDARNADDLVGAFAKIFSSIENSAKFKGLDPTPSAAAPAVTNPGASSAAAVVEVDNATWSSRLKFYQINSDGTVNADAFSEPSFANRKTIINDGKTNRLVVNLADNDMSNANFGLSDTNAADKLEWRDALLKWTARSQDDTEISNLAKSKKYSQDYRIRAIGKRDLGDILDSSVNTIGDIRNGRNEFLVTAANDGMVHLFQSAANDANPYDLKLSYIPAGMERHDDQGQPTTMGHYLKSLASPNYGNTEPHRYMVNGGIVVRRTADGKGMDGLAKGQQSFLFGAMGQGGRGAYALNIGGQERTGGVENIGLNAGQDSWLSQVPLFETEKGAGNTLGYTVGMPQIGRISIQRDEIVSLTENVRYAGFLASGYSRVRGGENETALYVYEMLGQEAGSGEVKGDKAGTLIQKITVDGGVGGLSAPTLVDTDFDGVVDVAYAGDFGGSMYRFDLRGAKPSDWKVERIYKGDQTQPITAAPAISRRAANKYVVIFGTGSDVYEDDGANTDQQAIYGIFDDLSKEVVPSEIATSTSDGNTLLVQTLTPTEVSGQTAYTLSDNKIAGHKGWKINLNSDGERVVVKPTMVLRTAVISTRTYSTKAPEVKQVKSADGTKVDVCVPEEIVTGSTSSTMLLGVNAETGGQPSKRSGYVQFIKGDVGVQPYAYAGLRQPGIISFTYMDSTKLNDSPVTRDGDSGGSGTDQPFKAANTEIPNNKCFSRQAMRVLLTNSSSSFDVEGRVCGIRRLSWREIFF